MLHTCAGVGEEMVGWLVLPRECVCSPVVWGEPKREDGVPQFS